MVYGYILFIISIRGKKGVGYIHISFTCMLWRHWDGGTYQGILFYLLKKFNEVNLSIWLISAIFIYSTAHEQTKILKIHYIIILFNVLSQDE